MVASIDRANQSEANPPSRRKSSHHDNLQTKDARAVAASMENDPFRYYAERDAGIATTQKLPINPKDPFSFYYGQEYEAEQEAAAKAARDRAAELQAKYVAPAKTVRPRADAEMSMNLGSVAVTEPVIAATITTADPITQAVTDREEHPLQRWGREDREAREAANQKLKQGVTQLKDTEEQTLANGQNRLWFMTGLATLTVLLAGGAYFLAPKILERLAAREASRDQGVDSGVLSPAASGDPINGAIGETPTSDNRADRSALDDPSAMNSDRRDAAGLNRDAGDTNDGGSLAANGTLDVAGADDNDRRGANGLDPDDTRDRDGGASTRTVKRDEILAPLGLNGGNFVSWWRGEPVNSEGGSRSSGNGSQDDENGIKSNSGSTDLDGDTELKSEGSGLRFGSDDQDSGDDRQTISNPTSSAGGQASVSAPYNSGDDGDDGDYSVPAPGGGLLFGGDSDSGRVPASMTNETAQLSILGITNAIPQGIDAPVQNDQRVASYRVTDTYLPCQSSDASDCREVHPVYGYHSVPHFGVDIAMPNGAPIFAVGKQGSTVTVSCYTDSGGGLVAQMSSSSMPEYEFKALHLSDCIEGTFDVGTIVASVGASGGATGPHLHWEAFYNDVRVDPPRWSIEYAIKGNITRDDAAKFTY